MTREQVDLSFYLIWSSGFTILTALWPVWIMLMVMLTLWMLTCTVFWSTMRMRTYKLAILESMLEEM